MSKKRRWLWALSATCLLLSACQSNAPRTADREKYVYATVTKGLGAEARFDACSEISVDLLVAECMLAVAQTAAQVHQKALSDYCPRLPDGVWKDECYFLAAEAVKRHDKEEAAEMCNESGQFVDDCGQHLWQTAVGAIAPRSVEGWEIALPKAERLYKKWEPILAETTDFESRFWQRFFQRTFEPQRVLDLSACDKLDPDYAERCAGAGAELYWRRIHMLVGFKDGLSRFCDAASTSRGVEAVGNLPRLEAEPHPALAPVIKEFYEGRCTAE